MVEPVISTIAVVGTAKKIWEFVKDAKDLSDKAAQQEIQKMMLQIREEALEMQEENMSLKQELFDIKSKIKVDDDLEFSRGVYWKMDEGKKTGGPYCQKCKDSEAKIVNLQTYTDSWKCLNCNSNYWM